MEVRLSKEENTLQTIQTKNTSKWIISYRKLKKIRWHLSGVLSFFSIF